MSEWSVAEPKKLTFDEPVSDLHVRIVNGTVNVVGTDEGSARLEISEIDGPPLVVTQSNGTLTVAYEDLPWKGFLKGSTARAGGAARWSPGRSREHPGRGRGGRRGGRGLRDQRALRGARGHRRHDPGEPLRLGPRRDGLREPGGPGGHRRPPLQLRLRRLHRRRGLGSLRARRVRERLDDRGPRPGRPDRRPAHERLGRDRHPPAAPGGRGRRGQHGERLDLQRLRGTSGPRPVGRPQDHRPPGRGHGKAPRHDRLRLDRPPTTTGDRGRERRSVGQDRGR